MKTRDQAGWAVSLALLGSAMAAAGKAQMPNVLLLCIDDLRSVTGPCGGAAKTPNLDRLAQGAAVFTRHYVQWPVCGPSRASMLGGLRPDTTGIYEIEDSQRIAARPKTHPTLPRHFNDHGYETLGFGKVYHYASGRRGFGWSKEPWIPWSTPSGWTCYVHAQPSGSAKVGPAYEIYDGADELHNDSKIADRVIAALERDRGGKPFFIAGGFLKPHLPFVAPKKYWDMYSSEEIRRLEPASLPEGAAGFMQGWSEMGSYEDPQGRRFAADREIGGTLALDLIHAYYASVSFVDAQVGRVLDRLDALGLARTTAVVVWSDHGFHLGDHGRWGKHTQFEQSMRSPLIIRLPGRHKAFGETKAIAESLDIYPTLCEYAGLPVPDFLEGESLLPVIEGRGQGKEAALSQIRPVGRRKPRPMAYSVRTRDFRYVEWRDPDKGNTVVWRELYDHRNDPSETASVAANPDHAETVERHAAIVRAAIRRTGQ